SHLTPGSSVNALPFDPTQVVDNLRCERYVESNGAEASLLRNGVFREAYYVIRPLMPVSVRKHLQRRYFHGWREIPFPQWPVDCTVEDLFDKLLVISMQSRRITRVPFVWFWPDGAPSCTIMTHDVETAAGLNFCSKLMDLDDSFGLKSSFQIV